MILIATRVDNCTTRYIVLLGQALTSTGGPCEVSVMAGWFAARTAGWSAKAVIAMTLLALLLVAVVPVALLTAVILMLLGHVIGGLALFGGSVLAAAMAVSLAGITGMQHLRKLLTRGSFGAVRLDRNPYTDVAEPSGSDYTDAVRLDRSDYDEVR
jgi:uncharacterized membrane protein YdjX (TVP38/TMEM64 family)